MQPDNPMRPKHQRRPLYAITLFVCIVGSFISLWLLLNTPRDAWILAILCALLAFANIAVAFYAHTVYRRPAMRPPYAPKPHQPAVMTHAAHAAPHVKPNAQALGADSFGDDEDTLDSLPPLRDGDAFDGAFDTTSTPGPFDEDEEEALDPLDSLPPLDEPANFAKPEGDTARWSFHPPNA